MDVNYITLFVKVASDCDLDPYTVRYCVQRLKSEGLQFWTRTLPTLSKAVLSSLEKGYFDRPLGFAWKRKSLRYFAKFLNKIFDPKTGKVLNEPCPIALYCLRQVCDYAYKLALDFTDSQIESATEKFVTTDDRIGKQVDWDWVDVLRKRFETHFSEASRSTVDKILKSCPPRSGPGTFSPCSSVNSGAWFTYKKHDYAVHMNLRNYAWASRPTRLRDAVVPEESTPRTVITPMPRVHDYEPFSQLLFVPKDSRGPRTIVREPYHLLRYQMSFNKFLGDQLERVSNYRVNFQDQQVNRDLALLSSRTKEYSTLDLRDASDSVSYEVMRRIFQYSPGLSGLLRLARSRLCLLPNGETRQLKKLSGMGSGYTFPSMSLLIYLAVCEGISVRFGIPFREVMKTVYVYGDDLIVKTKHFQTAVSSLQRVGLNLNPDKCFTNSHFRESCGGDFFNGNDVAPIRLKLSGSKLLLKGSLLQITGNLSFIQVERHCRELVKGGLLCTAEYLYQVLESRLGRLPQVCGESPVLGRYSISQVAYPTDELGHYTPVRCIVPVIKTRNLTVTESREYSPWLSIRNSIASAGSEEFTTTGQLEHEVAIPRAVKYRRSRVSGFRLMG